MRARRARGLAQERTRLRQGDDRRRANVIDGQLVEDEHEGGASAVDGQQRKEADALLGAGHGGAGLPAVLRIAFFH